jgi:hypothetical protein
MILSMIVSDSSMSFIAGPTGMVMIGWTGSGKADLAGLKCSNDYVLLQRNSRAQFASVLEKAHEKS